MALRVNPDIDANTHPYISTGLSHTKFGVPHAEAEGLYRKAADMPNIDVVGIGCHIGSLLLEAAPSLRRPSDCLLVDRLDKAGIRLRDVGGGIGIRYKDESPQPRSLRRGVLAALGRRPHTVIVDPGRSIVGNAGLLLTRVEYLKPGFLVVDAGMNDLIRPALYGAWHEVQAVRESASTTGVYDIVGPVCESADFLAKGRPWRHARATFSL